MSRRVLVVSAHPDDEVLGVGGTVARHVAEGDSVTVVIVADGATSRYEAGSESGLEAQAAAARQALGVEDLRFLRFPDQRLDREALLEVTQRLESVFNDVRPEVVYVHHWGDLNRDHRIVFEATMVAARPVGAAAPEDVYAYETPSSSEWAAPEPSATFVPTHFVDITATLEAKLRAMAAYATELREPPHPRSLESLRTRSAYWGQLVGLSHAEPFQVVRQIRRTASPIGEGA